MIALYLIAIALLLIAVALATALTVGILVPVLRGLRCDGATANSRTSLDAKNELPAYLAPSSGEPDPSLRWPGWDGWYFFMVPDDIRLPLKMVRASIMTGLYGLDGVDDYSKLPPGLSAFHAIEHLVLTPTEVSTPDGLEKLNFLSHRYLPKRTALGIHRNVLDVTSDRANGNQLDAMRPYGRVEGAWPRYRFDFVNPDAEIKLSLQCTMKDIIWWADIPGIFTYFAAFGDFSGSITYGRGAFPREPGAETNEPQTYAIEGRGAFEHGYARKPFNFDTLWYPVRIIEALVPSFKAIRYQYELFLGDHDLHGGFMLARGFGIDFRNLGGLYLNGDYVTIKRVTIEYPEAGSEKAAIGRDGRSVTFHREWKVSGVTDHGLLEYTGRREWPPPRVSSNMIYYNFSFSGSFKGKSISGTGYGEYLSL